MDKYIIVGLGNIGLKYRKTRHNVGFMLMDKFSDANGIKIRKNHCEANIGEGFINQKSVVLAKPRTYMNLSGQSVRALLDWYKLDMSSLVVIYDDMDLPLGEVRMREKGGAGTHNGMKSIISHLGSNDFIRIRIGIGKPEHGQAVSHVLGKFAKTEKEAVENAINKVGKALDILLEEGINAAMNYTNQKEG